ncbi:hypothetical protein [Metabacillus idriensis]|uniref:hypothetical protein n=1 Tax=Metabacillus idriensis TaxID=324768 RepID=UPI00174A243E|nr:hypothetical protein [Metabacillus idriensis]
MTNWLRGNLVVRGTKDNIRRFLTEILSAEDMEIHENDLKMTIRSDHGFYVEGTKRNFVDADVEFHFATEEVIQKCILNNFSAAWSIDPEPYTHMSKEYDIEIKVGGVEIYGGFVQQIEIQKGEIVNEIVEEINRDFREVGDEVSEEYPTSYDESLSSDDWDPSEFIDDKPDNDLDDDNLPF